MQCNPQAALLVQAGKTIFSPSPALLHPELIHAGEGIGVFYFQSFPFAEVARRPAITGKKCANFLCGGFVKIEADEFQPMTIDEAFEGRNADTCFLYVEKQIAALAHAEEIVVTGHTAQRSLQ